MRNSRKNPAVPLTQEPVIIKFQGVEYEVALAFNDIPEIEMYSGRSFLDDIRDVGRCARKERVQPRIAFLRAALFVLLKRAGCPATIDDVGNALADFDYLGLALQAITLAYLYSQAVKKPDPRTATAES
jgi:hypothetical protein